MRREVAVCGVGFLSNSGINKDAFLAFDDKSIDYPKINFKEIVNNPPNRLNRMPAICKWGITGADLSIQSASFYKYIEQFKDTIGVVIETQSGSLESDKKFYDGLVKQGTKFASPMHFSYTLPSMVLGEICIHYKINGENLCFSSGDNSSNFLIEGYKKVSLGFCDFCLAGKIECINEAPDSFVDGEPVNYSLFFLLGEKDTCIKNNIVTISKIGKNDVFQDDIKNIFDYCRNIY